uniref:Uncharacterized protein n=1 Tax=Chlorobium chlorochromatii (strain CaD3) TaxID=340177 RepID=Q3ASA6_CHLCH
MLCACKLCLMHKEWLVESEMSGKAYNKMSYQPFLFIYSFFFSGNNCKFANFTCILILNAFFSVICNGSAAAQA